MASISKNTFKFLKELKNNNNRAWFEKNKSTYLEAKENWETFLEELLPALIQLEPKLNGLEVKKSTYRMNRDIRFSKDKTPYKTNFSAVFVEGGKKNTENKAGYFLSIGPGHNVVIGGAHMPPTPWISKIRKNIDSNAKGMRKTIENKAFKNYFGEIEGEQLKKAPKGYNPEHPDIDLLRYKDFLAIHRVDENKVTSKDYAKYVLDVAKAVKPFNDFLNN